MASFQEHLNQAKENLKFLEQVNQNLNNFWDWQVTVCFYVAIHIVNAHIAKTLNLHYRMHHEVENAINPYRELSPTKFTEEIFTSYMKLKGLSKRSRYLTKEVDDTTSETAYFTYDKHLARAIRHLDIIVNYLADLHNFIINPVKITCLEIKSKENLKYFIKA